jgi:uncharacterized membrane protein YkoI
MLTLAVVLCLAALPLAASGAGNISHQKAISIALAKYKNSKPIHCELDYDDGVYAYNVEVVRMSNKRVYDVCVRASSGKILYTEYEGTLASGCHASDIRIGYSTAISKARSKAPGGKYLGFDVEWRSGTPRYEVDFRMKDGRERSVLVNAKSGTVIGIDRDDYDDDHDHDHVDHDYDD